MVRNVLELLGLLAILVGCYLVAPPLALIVGGLLMVAAVNWPRPKRQKADR